MSLLPAFIAARQRQNDSDPPIAADSRDSAADDNVFNLLPPDSADPLDSERPEPEPIGRNRHPVDMTDLSRLSIDRDGHLYWDGKPVQTQHRLALSRAQFIGAIVVSSFVIVGALGAAIQGAASARDWACRAGWIGGGCALPAPPRPDFPA